MGQVSQSLEKVLEGYSIFLRERQLAPQKNRPHLVRWVSEFLDFARKHPGYTFDQTLDLFLADIGSQNDAKPWQIQQAADAVRSYKYQYRISTNADEAIHETAPCQNFSADEGKLLERFREVIRLRHYSPSTEKTYLHWTKRFMAYQRETGGGLEPDAADVRAFLTRLAMADKVSASTQNQAFNALLLLFREVLRKDLDDIAQTVRAKRGRRLPTVLSVSEVQSVLAVVEPEYQLMAKLLYGTGLRLMELILLRVKDLDFDAGLIMVRQGKGDQDRTTLLPTSLREELRVHLDQVRLLHEKDLAAGYGEAPLPNALARKYPNAGREWGLAICFSRRKSGG